MYYVSKSILLTGSGSSFGSLYLQGADPHTSDINISWVPGNTITGWTVGKTASGSYSSLTASSTAAATTFNTQPKPNGELSTTIGEGWVFGPYIGVFARNTMSVQWEFRGTTINSQQGRVFFRLWKGHDKTGTNATLIDSTVFSTNIVAITAAGSRVSASYNMPSSLVMENEYMFIETAWGITTAGGANGANVLFRQGSASYFKTGPFEDNSVFIIGDDRPGYA